MGIQQLNQFDEPKTHSAEYLHTVITNWQIEKKSGGWECCSDSSLKDGKKNFLF